MDEKSIGNGLRAMARKTLPGPDCLDEYDLAASAAYGPGVESRAKFEEHLSHCAVCLERVTDLVAIRARSDEATVSELTLHKANTLVRRPPFNRQLSRWATAAVVVLAFGLVFLAFTDQTGVETVSPSAAENYRQSRSIGEMDSRPNIIQPAEGGLLSRNGAEIEWTPVPGSLYYDVRVVSSEGELVGQQRVGQNHWNVPEGLLQPGAEYYVRVYAYLAEAKRLSSHHVLFTVEQP